MSCDADDCTLGAGHGGDYHLASEDTEGLREFWPIRYDPGPGHRLRVRLVRHPGPLYAEPPSGSAHG